MLERGIDHWATRELALTKRQIEIQNSLANIEAEAGAALLDAPENESDGASHAPSFDKLERARSEVRALAAAISTCRVRRLEAIKTKRAAEVGARRKGAADKA